MRWSGNYDPVDVPLSWTKAGGLVILHDERYSSHDVMGSSCRGSGLFALPDGGAPARALSVGAPACYADGAVAVAPDGTWAVFSQRMLPNNSGLARLEIATSRLDTLPTACAVYLQGPAISPDGARIAAVGLCRDRDQEHWTLYVMNRDGSGLRPLSTHPADQAAPSWAPGGDHLAAGQDGHVVVLAAEGEGRRALTRGGAPSWSPDGAWIAFVDSIPGGERNAMGIFVVRPDGSGRREVFRNAERGTFERGWGPRREGEPGAALVWSPDARWIAFPRRFDAGVSVWRVEAATGRVEQVTRASR